jgi:signal transduction histidine kinase/tetratricopeptide (TPR) repeat protein
MDATFIQPDSVRMLVDKAAARSDNGDAIAPIRFLDSALQGKSMHVPEKMIVYGFKSDIYNNRLQQYNMAMLYADSMLQMVEKEGTSRYKTEYTLANYNKGDILFNQKNYNEAYSYYYKARLVGKTNLDSCTLGEYSFRLALVLYRQSRFIEAAREFHHSLDESSTCDIDFGKYYRLQQLLNNIGLSYYKAGYNDSALFFYDKGLDYIARYGAAYPERENMNEVAKAVIYGNMADIFSLQGDTVKAKEFLKKSIAINIKKGNDNRDAQFSQVKLAEIYLNEGSADSMHSLLQVLRRELDTTENGRAEMDWNRLMWRYYNGKSDPRTAYIHLVNFTALRDSLEKDANQIKSADLSQQIKMMESQYEIQALQKDNEVKNIYLWIAVIASILAVIIVFFIFRNLVRSRRNVHLLQSLNNQVNEQKLQLQTALSTVEEKNRQQDRILRAVAHDLRGPVATISMLSDLVQQEENADARAEMIGFIRTSCNNSLELIAEILEAADQSKKQEQEKESVSINALVKNAVEILQLRAGEKQQSIICELPKNDIFVMVNPEKIKRVIHNLVTNSIKFSEKGKAIKISVSKEIDGIVLAVADNGIGIPEDIQSKVFDMFTEAKRKGTLGELPYGLGLSICKQIVEAHGGTIWLTSQPGQGTTFFIKLPA